MSTLTIYDANAEGWGVHFSGTVSLGHIASTILFVVGLVLVWDDTTDRSKKNEEWLQAHATQLQGAPSSADIKRLRGQLQTLTKRVEGYWGAEQANANRLAAAIAELDKTIAGMGGKYDALLQTLREEIRWFKMRGAGGLRRPEVEGAP